MEATMSAGIEGRPQVPLTDYDNVGFDELISVYKQAYTEAGFRFKEQATREEKGVGGSNITRLVFEFSVPEYPKRKAAVASFVVIWPQSENRKCAPCSVHREIFGADFAAYDSAEWAIVQPKMDAADLEANTQIRNRLGKSLRPAPAYPSLPPRVN
jgi:hypothetical protein